MPRHRPGPPRGGNRVTSTLALALAAGLLAAAAGCKTDPAEGGGAGGPVPPEGAPAPAGTSLPGGVGGVRASDHLSVGRVSWTDLAAGHAVVELDRARNPGGRYLVSRGDTMEATAILTPTAFARGLTLGARILDGQPRVGEEVIRPSAETEAEIDLYLQGIPLDASPFEATPTPGDPG